jgi:hypothetical protein
MAMRAFERARACAWPRLDALRLIEDKPNIPTARREIRTINEMTTIKAKPPSLRAFDKVVGRVFFMGFGVDFTQVLTL